jgi:replicative DNA helicase
MSSFQAKPATEELLPHDKMAEQAVLGALIYRNDLLPQIQDYLTPDDFFSPANQKIYSGMLDLSEQAAPIDEVSLSTWLKDHNLLDASGGVDYLLNLTQTTPVADNAEYYAAIVQEKSQLRAIITTAYDLAKEGQAGQRDISEFLGEASERFREIENRVSTRSYAHLKDILLKNFEHLEALSENPQTITGVPTGFHDLDELTRGLQHGDLIILAARPSMGKTAFAMNVGMYASLNASKPVLMFSLEMPKEHIAMRLICSEAKVNSQKLWVGDLEPEDWEKLVDATGRMMEAPLLIDDMSGITPAYVRKVARQAAQQYAETGLGLIIIDYLQLMQSGRRVNSREQEISDISRQLKAVAKEFSVPVIALSQLNRDLERRADKHPIMADLRESGALEQDADLIMFIYRDEVYHPNTEDKGIAEIIVAKHRNGECGTKRLAFIGQYTKFANLALGD